MDGDVGTAGPIPGDAHPVLWALIVGALGFWWFWPYLQVAIWRPVGAFSSRKADAPAPDEGTSVWNENPWGYPLSTVVGQVDDRLQEENAPPSTLNFEPQVVFTETFAAAAVLLGEALELAPSGFAYMEVTASIHAVIQVLDKLLQAWGSSSEEMARVSRLNEGSPMFAKNFGTRCGGCQSRGLLALAGFEQQTDETPPRWLFSHDDPLSRMKALTVRLCLRKHTDLQRFRGTMRWAQDENASVVPKCEHVSLAELLGLYRELKPTGFALEPATIREKTLESAVRAHLTTRRVEAGSNHPLALHEGLAGVARVIAQDRRQHLRSSKGDVTASPGFGRAVDARVRKLLAGCPLPPGFHAAHLHWQSTELPRLFGLASTRGASAGAADPGAGEEAAEIMAQEAVASWTTRQMADVSWPCAAIVGVGAALDYTLNRGFVVALLAGFEGLVPEEESGGPADPSSLLRPGSRCDSSRGSQPAPEPAVFGPKSTYGAKVRTLGSNGMETTLQKK